MKKFILLFSAALFLAACNNSEVELRKNLYNETASIRGKVVNLTNSVNRYQVDRRAYDGVLDSLTAYDTRLEEMLMTMETTVTNADDRLFLRSEINSARTEIYTLKGIIKDKQNPPAPVLTAKSQTSSAILVDIHSMNDAQLKSLMKKCEKVNWDANKLFQKYNILITSDDFETLQTVWTLQVLMDAL